MFIFRPAQLQDIEGIQNVEKKFYEGYVCPKGIIKSWIKNLSENFIVAERNGKIFGFIFFEYLDKREALPFVHEIEHKKNGKYAYVSDVGVLGKNTVLLQELLYRLIEKSKKDGCLELVWITGSPEDRWHKLEVELLLKNGFEKKEKIEKWDAYPGHFVSNHYLWIKGGLDEIKD
ncbi:MAG: hypothetical protein JSV92_03135 [archaeon]|nr:MAG: hypothetical protein JSV92_03135 [archaeon]